MYLENCYQIRLAPSTDIILKTAATTSEAFTKPGTIQNFLVTVKKNRSIKTHMTQIEVTYSALEKKKVTAPGISPAVLLEVSTE